MRKDPHQQGRHNQQKTSYRTKPERNCKPNQPRLVPFRSQADQRELQKSVEEPERRQSYRDTKVKRSGYGMAEFSMRRQPHEIVEIWRHGARYQCRKDKSLAHRQDCGGMGWSEGQGSYSLA